jgi:NADH-quinone oxidoreductase subunit L
MYLPLVVLATFAVCVAWTIPGTGFSLAGLLEQARPAGEHGVGLVWEKVVLRPEAESHHGAPHIEATLVASATALFGFFLATAFYCLKWIDPKEVAQQFAPIYRFLVHKWYFDELYQVLFVRPVFIIAQLASGFDKNVIDRFINALARWTLNIAHLDDLIDRYLVDGVVNLLASWTYAFGLALRSVQTGQLRQYVMFIVVGTVGLFVAASFLLSFAFAGN